MNENKSPISFAVLIGGSYGAHDSHEGSSCRTGFDRSCPSPGGSHSSYKGTMTLQGKVPS